MTTDVLHLSPLSPTVYKDTLAQIDALHGKYHVTARRAWDYIPGYPVRRHFVLELEPGRVLTRGGQPVVMGNEQVHFLERILNQREPWPPKKDIFRHLDRWAPADRVQVVGPGPNGKAHWHELDPRYVTIVVNKAVEIADIRKDIWLTSEGTACRTHWFRYGVENHLDIACMSNSDLYKLHPDAPWTHELGGVMGRGDVQPTPLLLRGGATITSMAVHLAYWLGAREIVLCGIDMGDNVYWDYDPTKPLGSHENEVAEYKAGVYKDFSKYIPLMQELCDWLTADGIRVGTLSPSALQVEEAQSW